MRTTDIWLTERPIAPRIRIIRRGPKGPIAVVEDRNTRVKAEPAA